MCVLYDIQSGYFPKQHYLFCLYKAGLVVMWKLNFRLWFELILVFEGLI
jgi:hypothetical protein